jgi:phosphopentomutase
MIIAADHGNDPTFRGTDATREQVRLCVNAQAKVARPRGKIDIRRRGDLTRRIFSIAAIVAGGRFIPVEIA